MPALLSLNATRAGDRAEALVEATGASRRQPVEGRRRVERFGLEGELAFNGAAAVTANKALYAYPSEHYPFWDTVRAQLGMASWTDKLPPGAVGEHLTLAGVLEADVWIGDLLRFPDCTLAVSEPRLPAPELNSALGFAQAEKAMAAQGWCGFHLAVRNPGTIATGEAFSVVPGPREIGVAELFRSRMARLKKVGVN